MFNLEYLLLNLVSKSSIVIVLFLSSSNINFICFFLTLYDIGFLLCRLISFSSSYLLVHLNKFPENRYWRIWIECYQRVWRLYRKYKSRTIWIWGTFLDNKTKMIDVINYLEQKGFHKFSYLTANGTEIITDFSDHYQYCNIVCVNKSCILPLF